MKFSIMLLAGLFAFAGAVGAATPNYKYAEVAYGTGDLELALSGVGSADIDQDGFEIEGSYAFIDEQLWLYASYADLSGDEAGLDIDVETLELAAGWIFGISDTTSIDLSARYREDALSVSDGFDSESVDVDGLGVAIGVRSNITEMIEIYGRLGYFESDYEGALTYDIGAVFSVTDLIAISVSYEGLDFDDDGVDLELSQLQAGFRVKF